MSVTTTKTGFTSAGTYWAGDDPPESSAWTWDGSSDVYNKSVSMLIYTNNTDFPQTIQSVYLHMGRGQGNYSYTDSEGTVHTHPSNGTNFSTYMFAKDSSGTILDTSQTISITEPIYRDNDNQTYHTDSALTTYTASIVKRTFTFSNGVSVAPGASVTFYNHYIMNNGYATVVAIKANAYGSYGGTVETHETYTINFNTSTGVASFTGYDKNDTTNSGTSLTVDYLGTVTATATASPGYILEKYTGTDGLTGEETEWTECAGLSTYTDDWTVTMDRTITAHATVDTYTITYDSNGGSSVSSQTYNITTNLSLAGAPAKTGSTFSGWVVSSTSGNWTADTTYSASQNIGTGQYGNVTLRATWDDVNYLLTVNKGTGIQSVSGGGSKTYGASCSISAVAKAGYSFSYWLYNNSVASTDNPYTFTMPASNRTYTAIGAGNTYYVKYNANGGSGTMSNSTHVYGTSSKLRANTFTYSGYEFKGWATSTNATSATYNDEHSVSALTTTSGGIVNLYAVWAQNVFSITTSAAGTYQATVNGGGNYSYGDTCTIEAIYPEGCGYKFDYFIKDGTTTITTNPYSETVTAATSFTAYSQPIQYIIQFNGNTGEGSMSSMICQYDTNYSLTSNAFNKDGYQFIGWSTSADSNTVVYENTQSINNLAANDGDVITLYAVWKAISQVFIWAANAAGVYGWRRALKYIYNTQLTSTNITISINTTAMSDVDYGWSITSGTSLLGSGTYSAGSKNVLIDKAILEAGATYFTIDKLNALDTITVLDQNGNILTAASDSDTAISYLLTTDITTVKVTYECGNYILSLTSSGANYTYQLYGREQIQITTDTLLSSGIGGTSIFVPTNLPYIVLVLPYMDTYTYTISASESNLEVITEPQIDDTVTKAIWRISGDATIDVKLEIESTETTSNLLDEGLLDVMQIF